MKISHSMYFIFALLFIVIFSSNSVIAQVTFAGAELLGCPTNNSIKINVVPDADIEYLYEYGTAQGGPYSWKTSYATATGGAPHEVVITGLNTNTRYYYRMRYHIPGDGLPEEDWETRDEYTFHTQRAQGSTFVFTIISDTHAEYSDAEYQQAIQNVQNDNPDLHLDLGDTQMTDYDGNQSQVNDAYLQSRTNSTMGSFGHSVPIFLASGNHENEEGWNIDEGGLFSPAVASIQARKAYFPTPNPNDNPFYSSNTDILADIDAGTYGDQYREDYYAWTWGDALFVVFDPFQYTMYNPYGSSAGEGAVGENDPATGDRWNWTLGEEQYLWLKQTLQNSNAKYKFMFAHHMLGGEQTYVREGATPAHMFEWGGYNADGTTWGWTTERSGWEDDPIRQLMIDYGVSAFFHGHDHQYAYQVRDEIVYQCLPKPSPGLDFNYYSESDPYTERVIGNSGHLRVTVTPDQATVEYVRSNTTGISHSYPIAPNSSSSDPTITITGTPLSSFSSEPGTPSAEQSYTVSGSNLTDDITINAPTDFEISTTSGSGFGSSLGLTQSGGSVPATDIYVRFNRATEGTSSGDVTHTSSGATTQNVAVSGTAGNSSPGIVTLDGTASSGTADDVSSIDVDHTTGTGNNRLMLVGVSWNCGSTARTISSVTFTPDGGSPTGLDEVGTEQTGTQLRYSAIYSLLDPPSGETGTVTVTFSGSVSNGIVAGVANFAGVDQTTPLGPSDSTNGNSTAPSVVLTGLDGDELVFDNVFQGASGSSQTLTAGSGQTELWNAWIANARAAASTEEATGSTVTMSWTATSASYWAIVAVAINPAPITDPTITISGTPLNPFNSSPGTPSAEQSYTVSGINLADDITITPPTDFEISTTSGSGFGSSLTLTQSGGSVPATDIYVRFNRATVGTSSGDIAHTSPGAATRNVAVSGTAQLIYLDGEVSSNTANGVSSIDIANHTTGTGNNRLMLVGVSWNCGTTDRTISSVTFTPDGGTAVDLTEVITEQHETELRYSAIYSLLDPPSGETGTVTVTFSGDVSNGIVAGVANFAGVNQTTPLGPSNGANGNSTAPSVDLTGLDSDELVFDNVFQGASGESQTLTAGSGQTEQWNAWIGNARAAASTEQAISSTATMSWTAASSSYWAIVAVAINPVAPTGPTITISGTPLSDFSSEPGTPSAPQSYTVSGSNLTDDISIIPPSDFEISLTGGSGWTSSLILTQSGGSVTETTIYVRFNRATAGTSSGDISHTSTGATTRNVAVSGTAAFPPAIIYFSDIGTATIKDNTDDVLTVTTTAAVDAGDDIIIVYASDPAQNLVVSVVDAVGNTYNEVAVAINQAQVRAHIYAAYNVIALPSGSTITFTQSGYTTAAPTARAALVSVFHGLADSGVLDQISTGENDASTTASSGATETTTQADELLIGGIGTEGPDGDTPGTWQNSFIVGARLGTTGGTADQNITASMGYRLVSSTGSYTASKTGMTNRDHAAAIATFRAGTSRYSAISSDYSGVSASIGHSNGDYMTATTTSGTINSIHVYRIDENAGSGTTVTPPDWFVDPLRYWGVRIFGTSPEYQVVYTYAGHPGIDDESSLRLATRTGPSDGTWVVATGTLPDQDNNTITLTGQTGTEYALASGVGDNSLPVNLTLFSAELVKGGVELKWITESQLNNAGFEIWRAADSTANYSIITSYTNNPNLAGDGNSSVRREYSFLDQKVESGKTYRYKLSDVDYDGKRTFHDVIEITVEIVYPKEYALYPNYPNPFNPETTIRFDIPENKAGNKISIQIYNINGQLIRTLFNGKISGGEHKIIWDSRNDNGTKLPSGIYFLELSATDFQQVQKMIMLK